MGDAAGTRRVPRATQGAAWGDFGESAPGPWFAQSVTRCGVLAGPFGRRGFVPGAEGMAPVGADGLWVVSESGSHHYQRQGGRPVVPHLVRLDLRDVRSWDRPHCAV